MKHLISIDDLDSQSVSALMNTAKYYKTAIKNALNVNKHFNKILLTDFYTPSTRTRFSFEAAMFYLGGKVIGSDNAAEFSSVAKGESLYDNFRVISGYCDIIVGRFLNEGDASIAADASLVPVINGGDGSGEHPTQALLDLYTILENHKKDKLNITFWGDNLRSRTVHSLIKLLVKMMKVNITFISHPKLAMSDHTINDLQTKTPSSQITNPTKKDIKICFKNTDVLYVTRTQSERGSIDIPDDEIKQYDLNQALINLLPMNAIILHPLPRNQELPRELDSDSRAKWFEQAHNGLCVRMAILELLTS